MPEPWAICSRDSRTLPFGGVDLDLLPGGLAGVGAADLDLVRQLGAGVAVPDDQLGCGGVGDLVDLAAGRGRRRGRRRSSASCWRCRPAPPGRPRCRRPGRRRWPGRRSRRRRRAGPRGSARRPSSRCPLSPSKVAVRTKASVRGALELRCRGPSPRRWRPAGPRDGDCPLRVRRRPGWRSVPGTTRRRLSLRYRPVRPGEMFSLGVSNHESSPDGPEDGLGDADQCTSSQSATDGVNGRRTAGSCNARTCTSGREDRPHCPIIGRRSSEFRCAAERISAPRTAGSRRSRRRRDPLGDRVAELAVAVLGEVQPVGQVGEVEVAGADVGDAVLRASRASRASTRGTARGADGGVGAGRRRPRAARPRSAIRSRKPRSIAAAGWS